MPMSQLPINHECSLSTATTAKKSSLVLMLLYRFVTAECTTQTNLATYLPAFICHVNKKTITIGSHFVTYLILFSSLQRAVNLLDCVLCRLPLNEFSPTNTRTNQYYKYASDSASAYIHA